MDTIKQSLKMSFQNMKSNKVRTFLTMLGIIIGVTSVIALITIVNGVISSVMGQFSSLGAGSLSITITGSSLKRGLNEADLEKITELDNVAGITPSVSFRTSASKLGTQLDKVTLEGTNEYYYAQNDVIKAGRGLQKQDVDNQLYVCVVDKDLAENLFPGENPVGQSVIVSGIQYKIVGLEGASDNLMAAMTAMNNQNDGTIRIPYTNALKLTGGSSVTSVTAYIADTDRTDETVDAIEAVLYKAFNESDDCYTVFNMDSLMETMNTMMKTMSYMLGGIASIALLVGGIGIMNMMLVSVTERTKEIGLRKALGATPGVIQLQFLLESIILSISGGIVGVGLGLLISYVAAILLKTPFAISTSAIVLGLGFSTAIGIVFGWTPARKASQLNPIDALRSE